MCGHAQCTSLTVQMECLHGFIMYHVRCSRIRWHLSCFLTFNPTLDMNMARYWLHRRFRHHRRKVRLTSRHFLIPKCRTHDFFVPAWRHFDCTLCGYWGIRFIAWRFPDSMNKIAVFLHKLFWNPLGWIVIQMHVIPQILDCGNKDGVTAYRYARACPVHFIDRSLEILHGFITYRVRCGQIRWNLSCAPTV